jgi:hypothetical protein
MQAENLQSNSIGLLHLPHRYQTNASRPPSRALEVRSAFHSGFGGLDDRADSGIYSSDSSGFGRLQQPSSYSMSWEESSVNMFFSNCQLISGADSLRSQVTRTLLHKPLALFLMRAQPALTRAVFYISFKRRTLVWSRRFLFLMQSITLKSKDSYKNFMCSCSSYEVFFL